MDQKYSCIISYLPTTDVSRAGDIIGRMKKAVLFKKGDHPGWVTCTACAWYCRIPPGSSGICAVRVNQEGVLYLAVYGKAMAVQVDPMEKKPLFHVLPGSVVLSVGTLGCNFGCRFCQNWEISQTAKEHKYQKVKISKSGELAAEIEKEGTAMSPEKLVEFAVSEKIPAIAYTYNEPAVFFEYAYDTAKLAKKSGLKNVFVSNGFESREALMAIRPYLDGINIDLKSFREDFYRDVCRSKLAPVLETVRRVHDLGIWQEVTTLVIPGLNDSAEELEAIAAFIASVGREIPWHLSAFHPGYQMSQLPVTDKKTLDRAYAIGIRAGLQFVYSGNIVDEEHESTFCPACGTRLIDRQGYAVKVVNFADGKCLKCGEEIAGIWG
jgi:pyruvate formate lyase activating enzyme